MTVVRQGVTRGPDGTTAPREDLNKGVGTTFVRTPGCRVHSNYFSHQYRPIAIADGKLFLIHNEKYNR